MSENARHAIIPRTLIFVFRGDELLLMRYVAPADKPGNPTDHEKSDRAGVYNPIGGHIEAGENIIESAIREAKEEAGITLTEPKLKGVIQSIGFAGKHVMLFVIVAGTTDELVSDSDEGEVEWVPINNLGNLNAFDDLVPLTEKLLSLKPDETIVGVANYRGFDLLNLDLQVA